MSNIIDMEPVTLRWKQGIPVTPLQTITELLVQMGVKKTIQSATIAVNKGTVYIENVRIANKEAMPVIVGRTKVTVEGQDYYVCPRKQT